jgi:hypothetical protein
VTFPDGSEPIDLAVAEVRDVRRLLQRYRRAEGQLTDAERDLIRRFGAEVENAPADRLYTGSEGLSAARRGESK